MQKDQIPLMNVCFVDVSQQSEMSFNDYVQQQEINYMLQEATKFFLRKNGLLPQNAMNEYIQSYFKGEQVLLKSYNSFAGHQINRVCFVINFSKVFELNDEKSGFDYFQLIKLICSDFPKEIIKNSLQIITQNLDGEEEALMKKFYSGNTFLKGFMFYFLFEEFLKQLQKILVQNNSLEFVAQHLLDNSHQKSTNPPFAPSLVNIFEVLLKSSSECYQLNSKPVQIFKIAMMKDNKYLVNGSVNYKDFTKHLYSSLKTDSQITSLLSMFDKLNISQIHRSNYRISEIQRIVSEKIQLEPQGFNTDEEIKVKNKKDKK